MYKLIGGKKIEYISFGKGPNLIFLHGGSVSFRVHTSFLRKLSKHFNVYAPSMPGAGKSSRLPKDWEFENYAEVLEGFVNKMGIDNPIICGHSLGGAIAVDFAARYPNLLSKLVLIAPAGVKQEASGKSIFEVFKNSIKALVRGKSYVREDILINVLYHGFDLVKIANIFGALDLRNQMKKVKAKTVVIWGKDDSIISVKGAKVYEANLRKCKIYKMEGGHDVISTHQEKITA